MKIKIPKSSFGIIPISGDDYEYICKGCFRKGYTMENVAHKEDCKILKQYEINKC